MSAVAGMRAGWLGGLVVDERLPERTVIVRTEAIAHSWRRDLVVAGRPDLLIGTRFVTPFGAAVELLESAGVPFLTGEETVRAARIASLLKEDLPLRGFDLQVLRERPGWEDALAKTVGDIEAACLDPAKLRDNGDPRGADLALLVERLQTLAGSSWTAARVLREATTRLKADSALWPYGGSSLSEISGHETVALARWLSAIPKTTLVGVATQPRRSSYVERGVSLFGEQQFVEPELAHGTERDLLTNFLFARPDVLTDPSRPRSEGPDGTVQIEEHSGIEEELDACLAWVVEQIAEHNVPMEQIAIVAPRLDPYAGLLFGRLKAVCGDTVHVVGGLPAIETSAGARVATVLRALSGYLHVDLLADVVPILRLATEDLSLSRRDAIAALYELGTAGGSAANPEGALSWASRNATRQDALATAVAEARKDEDAEQHVRQLERALEHLRALGPALDSLDRVARVLVEKRSLTELWNALREFLRDRVRIGVDATRILTALDEALAPLIDANILSGDAALKAVTAALSSIRLTAGRFGDARVTIVALSDAVGLSFRRVRVVGLAEGVVPANVREDPALPDSLRSKFGVHLPLAESRALSQLHALHAVVIATTERIVLSAPRMDGDGRYREPSGVLLEAAAALGRPPLGRGQRAIPDGKLMRRSVFAPARQHVTEMQHGWPIEERRMLDRAARSRTVPSAWLGNGLFDLDRIRRTADGAPGVMDGWFPDGSFVALPGLSSDRPISASALSRLLECPHRFLYERVLGWTPPSELVDEGSIDALSYGSLFHETAEAFYREHGAAFCEAKDTLARWVTVAEEIANQRFAVFLETYPLVGDVVRSAQRMRLHRDLRSLLESDWGDRKTFVDVEREFGPMALTVGAETVHVRGYIDRLDRRAAATFVRDLKTGRAKPRKGAELMPAYDVQIGLYGLVTRANATEWDVPPTVQGAYIYPADPSGDDRAFEDDFSDLSANTESWIKIAIGLLKSRRFPRTPDVDDCRFCPFKPVCGSAASERATELLAAGSGAVAEFATLKLGKPDDE